MEKKLFQKVKYIHHSPRKIIFAKHKSLEWPKSGRKEMVMKKVGFRGQRHRGIAEEDS